MLVKHNLWDSSEDLSNGNFGNWGYSLNYTIDKDYIIGGLKPEHDSALLYMEYSLNGCIDEEVTITLDIKNLGEVPIYFGQQGFDELQLEIKTINPNEKVTVKLEGIYKEISLSRQLRFSIRDKGKVKFSCKNISAYKGYGVDVHLPYIGNLPKDKQPLLPPEGHYNEITPL